MPFHFNCILFIILRSNINDDNLQNALSEFHTVTHNWKEIGGGLGCPGYELKQIKIIKDLHKSQDFLHEMLFYRMNQLQPYPLTWKAIVVALRKRTVKEEVLANTIAMKYCPSEGKCY